MAKQFSFYKAKGPAQAILLLFWYLDNFIAPHQRLYRSCGQQAMTPTGRACPQPKCRIAAACKYAVWNESAGNGLWGNPWFFYVWMGAVSICGTAPHFFTIAACLGAELCMWKESVWKKFRFGKRAIWPLKKRLPTQELGSISWESLRTARTAVSFYGSEPNAWSSVGYLTDISKKSSQFKHFDKIMCRIM